MEEANDGSGVEIDVFRSQGGVYGLARNQDGQLILKELLFPSISEVAEAKDGGQK